MMQTTGDRLTGGRTGTSEGSAVTGAKQRVYEVAKEVGLENKDLVTRVRALGIEIKNHMSALEPDDVVRIKRALDKERHENTVTERIQPTVIRRRNKAGVGQPAGGQAVSSVPEETAAGVESMPRAAAEVAEAKRGGGPVVRASARAEAPSAEHSRDTERLAARAEAVTLEPVETETLETMETAARPEPAQPEAAARVAPAGPRGVSKAAKVPRAEPQAPARVRETAAPTSTVDDRRVAAGQEESALVEPIVPADTDAPLAASAGPQTREHTTTRPKTQFELDLERARAAAAAKQAALAAQRSPEPSTPAAPVGRPLVGSIIDLPLPRIQITERGPGGRPLPAGTRGVPAQTTSIPGAGQVRGRFAEAQRGGGRRQDMAGLGRRKIAPGKKARTTQITTPAEHKRVIKMDETIAIAELSHQMGVKATEVLKKLWSMGMVGVNINQSIDTDTASLLASEFGYEIQNTAFQETAILTESTDAPEDLEARAPVVTVMGHVDHGKTSLLDTIRHTEVAAGEAGGITQHIGAYRVSAAGIGDVVFLDTPGHAAFTAMRARGAQATDIVVLVVAADDGVMPQTVEALNHAKDAEVPIVVAVNKCDRAQANPDRIRQQLSEHGLIPEEWGGETMYVNVSAYTKLGIDKLLEAIQLQADLLELKANPKKLARGVVVEAKLDRNRGPMATVLVEDGTLRIGDIVVTGEHMGKVRAMLNDKGSAVTEAGPSTPVEILGLDGVPEAGDVLNAVAEEKTARSVIENRRDVRRKKEQAVTGKVSLENILEKIQEGQVKELKVVLKADVQGSAEALKEALTKQSTEQVKVNVIQAGVGGITESDVNLAKAGGAIIIGFHVRPAGKASQLAEQEGVEIKLYDIIYEAIDDVKKAMVGLLSPIKKERALGKVEVREIYNIPKVGTVAGCFVADGKVSRQAQIRLVRDSVQIYGGRLGSLKRFKDDVREVLQGYECGLTIEGYNDVKVGDVIESYDIVEEAPTL
jgi:translation initiation factor IF-2